MDNIKQQIEQSKLLAGKVLGSLSKEQKDALDRWERSAYNKKIEEDILSADSFKDWNEKMDDFDSSVHWEQFVSEVQESKKKGKQFRLQIYKTVASVAAVLLIGFSSYMAYQLLNDNSHYQTLAEVDITPGSFSAQLVLADGEVVNLETSKKNTIREGHFSIQNEKGVLVYSENGKKEFLKPLMNTLKIPRGGEYQLVLPDGTKVWINSESELKYPVQFNSKERIVELNGEAYFDVESDPEHPFIVKTKDVTTRVLGTSFNVKSYDDEEDIQTVLVEGSVEMAYGSGNKEEKILLKPGFRGIFNKKDKAIGMDKVETMLHTAWKDHQFIFNNQNIDDIMRTLSRWYNVDIKYENEEVKALKFTIDVQRYNKIQTILEAIEATGNVEFKIHKREIYVKIKE